MLCTAHPNVPYCTILFEPVVFSGAVKSTGPARSRTSEVFSSPCQEVILVYKHCRGMWPVARWEWLDVWINKLAWICLIRLHKHIVYLAASCSSLVFGFALGALVDWISCLHVSHPFTLVHLCDPDMWTKVGLCLFQTKWIVTYILLEWFGSGRTNSYFYRVSNWYR